MRRRWVIWLLVFSGWTALAVFFAVSSSLTFVSTYQPPQWRLTLLMSLTEWYAWAALTPLVTWLARRFPLRAGSLVKSLAVHVPAGLLHGDAQGDADAHPAGSRSSRPVVISSSAISRRTTSSTGRSSRPCTRWRTIGRDATQELRASQLEARLAEARLQMLKMQLHPHFLFNTLNTISELVHEDPDTADRMIASLSQLLRESLDAGTVDRVPLGRELDLLERYVRDSARAVRRSPRRRRRDRRGGAAQRARAAPDSEPLVENSIRHGLAARVTAGGSRPRDAPGGSARARSAGRRGGARAARRNREGVGLGNTRARLQEFYGQAHSVEIRNADGGGTLVRLTMPWQRDTPEAGTR